VSDNKENADRVVLEKMTIGEMIKLVEKVKSNSEHNVTDESELKFFFGDPREGKVMTMSSMGAFGENEDGMFFVLDPQGTNMIDDLIEMLNGLRGDKGDCQCPKCVVERALKQER